MKIMKKISIGGINSVRGGFKAMTLFGLTVDPANKDNVIAERERVTVMTVVGIAKSYTTKTSDTMETSYAFNGEFQAVNRDGEVCIGPVLYLPEPAQSLAKAAFDGGATSIDIGFVFDAIRADASLLGYDYECKPLIEPKASGALEQLAARLLSAPEQVVAEPGLAEIPHAAKPAKGK